MVVRASVPVRKLEFNYVIFRPKDLKNLAFTAPCLMFSIKGIVWRTS